MRDTTQIQTAQCLTSFAVLSHNDEAHVNLNCYTPEHLMDSLQTPNALSGCSHCTAGHVWCLAWSVLASLAILTSRAFDRCSKSVNTGPIIMTTVTGNISIAAAQEKKRKGLCRWAS